MKDEKKFNWSDVTKSLKQINSHLACPKCKTRDSFWVLGFETPVCECTANLLVKTQRSKNLAKLLAKEFKRNFSFGLKGKSKTIYGIPVVETSLIREGKE